MHNISPARAMARQARRLFITGMIVVLVGLVLVAFGVLLVVVPLARAGWYSVLETALVGAGLLTAVVGLGLVIRGVTFPEDNQYARRMGSVLAQALDYRYTFIRNISRRGLGYVDAVLVGPNGALVFYFFARKGVFFLEGNIWFRRTEANKLRPASANPTQEAVKDVNALREYLAERGLAQVPVYAVVALPYAETVVTAQRPVVPVAHMPHVVAALRDNYLAEERIDAAAVKATVKAIMGG